MPRRKRKFKKRVRVVLICVVLLAICFAGIFYFEQKRKLSIAETKRLNEAALVAKIKDSYNKFVKVNKESVLYKLDGDKYVEVLKVNSEKEYTLADIKIDKDTKYFYIEELGYYVKYQDVSKIESLSVKDLRYKNYLPFNENVVTKDKFSLYQNGEVAMEVFSKLDTPIIEKDVDGNYIEYNDELYLVKNDDISNIYAKENTKEIESTSVPVTVYHFIYLEGDNSCNELICHSEKQIRSHFNYLRENNFFTLNTTELGKFIDGKIRLPEKSILITIDDGSRAWNFIPLLEEYKVNATLFLITSWYDTAQFKSDYMELASHTHALHTPGVCSGGQGSPLKCANRESLVQDLKTSRDVLNGTKALCFPFYEFNDYSLSVVEEAGFEMAFIGGYRQVTRGINKFKIPRIPLNDNTTLTQYANLIK